MWGYTQIFCDNKLLYGGISRRYFSCGFEGLDIVGEDNKTTKVDGDALFSINTSSKYMVIKDDKSGPWGEYEIKFNIESVRKAPRYISNVDWGSYNGGYLFYGNFKNETRQYIWEHFLSLMNIHLHYPK